MAHVYPYPTEGHDHAVSERCQEELSGKYEGHVQEHLDFLKEKCSNILACIDKLLQDESPLLVLKGENISLNKTCGLLYRTETCTETEKCTAAEREDIRADIESHLEDQLGDGNYWTDVKRCLQNSYGKDERTNRVDEVCKLAYNNAEMCRNHATHSKVEDFFNDHIHHLKCTCRSLANGLKECDQCADDQFRLIIGTSIGAVLLLIIFILTGCVCYHWRKAKESKKRSSSAIYLPTPNSDAQPIYQEVNDDDGRWMYNSTSNVPAHSMQYTGHLSAANVPGQDDERAYYNYLKVTLSLSPVPLSPISIPEESPDDKFSGYSEPIPSPDHEKDRNKNGTGNTASYETAEAILSPIPSEDAPESLIYIHH